MNPDPIHAPARREFFPATRNMGGTREGSTLWVCLHNTVSDDWVADAIARMFRDNSAMGSTQETVDSEQTQKSIPDDRECQGARSDSRDVANERGVHIEFCSMPTWKKVFWFRKHNRMIRRGAFRAARYCVKYDLPARYLTPQEIRQGKKGIVTHWLITQAFNVSGGHTDDGPPRGRFLRYLKQELARMEKAKKRGHA